MPPNSPDLFDPQINPMKKFLLIDDHAIVRSGIKFWLSAEYNPSEIDEAENKEEKLQEKIDDYTKKFADPYRAAFRAFIDEVIIPADTRIKLIKAFEMLQNKVAVLPKKKHGNIPL